MAVLFHPAQTGSQINILSPASQLVQAGQAASENLSLWFSRLPSLITQCDSYFNSCNTCHTIFLHVLFEKHNLVLVAHTTDLGLHTYVVYLLWIYILDYS